MICSTKVENKEALTCILLMLARLLCPLGFTSVLFHKGIYGRANECNSVKATHEREETWQKTDLAFEEIPNHNLYFQEKNIFDHLLCAKYQSRS